jgi:methylphosphotriester-DNA--protein-cysteine methyltransferase
VLVNLKLGKTYDGFLYLAKSAGNPQMLQSHHHIELELNLVIRGSTTYVVDGLRFTFSPRTLLWFFPHQEHQLVDQSEDAQFYVAVFKPSLINKCCRTATYVGLKRDVNEQDGVLSTVLRPEAFELTRKVLESTMQGSLDPDVLNREAGFGQSSDFRFEHSDAYGLNAGLRYLLVLCWRSQVTGKVTRDAVILHPAVRRALKLLSEDNSEPNLDKLACACGASKSYLSRTFHQQVGIPLYRFRNSLRLSRFFEIYQQSDEKTITETVYAAGFGSYAQFYKVFSQAYGRGPRDCLTNKSDEKDVGVR